MAQDRTINFTVTVDPAADPKNIGKAVARMIAAQLGTTEEQREAEEKRLRYEATVKAEEKAKAEEAAAAELAKARAATRFDLTLNLPDGNTLTYEGLTGYDFTEATPRKEHWRDQPTRHVTISLQR